MEECFMDNEIKPTGRGGKYNFPNAQLQRLEQDDDKRVFIGKALGNILAVSRAFEEPVKTDEELCDRLNWFFDTCRQTNQLPTVEKMCLAIGYDRTTVFDWISGRCGCGISAVAPDIIKKAKDVLKTFDAKLVISGKLNFLAYCFRAKNYYGMVDKAEYVLTPNQKQESDYDADEISKRYLTEVTTISD
jgi:hypothetical protein